MQLGAGLDHQPQGGVVHVGAVGQVQVLQGRGQLGGVEDNTRWGLWKNIFFLTDLVQPVLIY